MKEGVLPIQYLGVPLISKKLYAEGCGVLMEKVSARIDSWLSKHLSFAGRLQLISSDLYSLQVFWYSIFILPKKIIRLLEQKLNRYLRSGNDTVKARAKDGGLGLKRVEDWNKAAMLRHIWKLFAREGSLWVARV